MLAALILMGLATAMAAPVLISSMSDDDVDDDPPAADGPVSTDLAEGDPELTASGHEGLDALDLVAAEVDDPLPPVLVPVPGDVPDVPDDDLPDLEGIAPLTPIQPDLADVPGEDLDLPPDEILQPEQDPEPRLDDVLSLATNLDDTVDEIEGPDDVAYIRDFVSGEDILEITIFTDLPPDAVTVEVAASEDGQDSIVTANDQLIAVLRDAPEVDLDDFVLNVQLPLAS